MTQPADPSQASPDRALATSISELTSAAHSIQVALNALRATCDLFHTVSEHNHTINADVEFLDDLTRRMTGEYARLRSALALLNFYASGVVPSSDTVQMAFGEKPYISGDMREELGALKERLRQEMGSEAGEP